MSDHLAYLLYARCVPPELDENGIMFIGVMCNLEACSINAKQHAKEYSDDIFVYYADVYICDSDQSEIDTIYFYKNGKIVNKQLLKRNLDREFRDGLTRYKKIYLEVFHDTIGFL